MDLTKNWIIAEIGSVHDGSYGNALKLIEAAAEAGANCVKFQTHVAEAETLKDAPNPSYFKAEPRLEYFKRTSFTLEQWKGLKLKADEVGVAFLSSPFALEAVDLLEEVGVSVYKIPSGEVTNLPLLQKIAKTKKPTLLSSGMSSWEELTNAVEALTPGGPICLMQCTSMYPCTPERVGINVIKEMKDRFPKIIPGYSDHTLGYAAGLLAVAYGAKVIEKHFTYSKKMYGSDAKHSMEPHEFKLFSEALVEAWAIMESPVDKDFVMKSEMGTMKNTFQKSIVLNSALKAGHILTDSDLAFKKPGDGISASLVSEVVGRRLKGSFQADHKLKLEDME